MTSLAELPSYTLMQLPPDLTGEPANEAALKADFEKGDTKTKISALKKVLYFILNDLYKINPIYQVLMLLCYKTNTIINDDRE